MLLSFPFCLRLLVIALIASSNSSIFDGFNKNLVTPSFIACCAYSKFLNPVNKHTSISGYSDLIAATIASPSILFIDISEIKMSGFIFLISSKPANPLLAVPAISQFQFAHSIPNLSPSTIIGSSSTIITLYIKLSPYYPLTAPTVIPLIMYFCNAIYTTKIGITIKVTDVNSIP